MMSNDLFGKSQSIKQCTFDDIPPHFDKVKEIVPEAEHQEYVARMTECVLDGTAFSLEDDSSYIYYKKKSDLFAEGVVLYGKQEPLKLGALFNFVFTKIDPKVFKLDFQLHPGKEIGEYKSMLTITSIKRHQANSKAPLVIRVDQLMKRFTDLYEKRGITI